MQIKTQKPLVVIKASLIIAALLFSSFIIFISFSDNNVRAEYTVLDLSVTPKGQAFTLGVNESQTFTAHSLNASEPTFTWQLIPTGNFDLTVNGENRQLTIDSSLIVGGQKLSLSYPSATTEFVAIYCTVNDSRGLSGSLLKPITVADPYTDPGVHLDASTAIYNFMIQTDGLGWYRVINGTDGTISFTSNNQTFIEQQVVNNLPAGGTISLGSGVVWNGRVTIPATATMWSNSQLFFRGQNVTDIFANPQKFESFTLWANLDGDIYYLRNESTGQVTISTDLFSILNNTYAKMSPYGGNIYVKTGSYTLNTNKGPVIMYGNQGLIGENLFSTQILLASGSNHDMFWITNRTAHDYMTTISNVKLFGNIDGQTATSRGIYVNGSVNDAISDVFIDRVYVDSFRDDGILVSNSHYPRISDGYSESNGGNGITILKTNNPWITNEVSIFNNGNGIYMNTGAGSYIIGNDFSRNGREGGYFVSAQDQRIVANDFTGDGTSSFDTYDGLLLWSTTGGSIVGNNMGTGEYPPSCEYAIHFIYMDSGTIEANTISSGASGKIFFDGDNKVSIIGNSGYNSIGLITNPVSGNNIYDFSWAGSEIANNTLYTNWNSPKTLYIANGNVSSVQVDGLTVFTATGCTITLQPAETFQIVWKVKPTITIMGQ